MSPGKAAGRSRPKIELPEVVEDLPELSTAPQGRVVKLSDIKKVGIDFLSHEEAAATLGMHPQVFARILKTNERARIAYAIGQALGRAIIKTQTRKLCLIHGGPGAQMTIHMRKQLFGEADVQHQKHSGTVAITITRNESKY